MCDQFETCRTLAQLAAVNGDAPQRNLRKIRDQGLRSFLDGDEFW